HSSRRPRTSAGPRCQWAAAYEVRADAEAPSVKQDHRTLEHLRRALAGAPLSGGGDGPGLGQLVEALEARLRGLIPLRWRDVRAAEVVLEEVAREFGGEDPLKPAARGALTEAKRALQEYAASLERDGYVLELPEPTAEDLDLAHELLAKGLRLFA